MPLDPPPPRETAPEPEAEPEAPADGKHPFLTALGERPLDFVALMGSLAGVFGNVGQADYAAANGFLDAFAGFRQAQVVQGQRSGRTLAIDWPLNGQTPLLSAKDLAGTAFLQAHLPN